MHITGIQKRLISKGIGWSEIVDNCGCSIVVEGESFYYDPPVNEARYKCWNEVWNYLKGLRIDEIIKIFDEQKFYKGCDFKQGYLLLKQALPLVTFEPYAYDNYIQFCSIKFLASLDDKTIKRLASWGWFIKDRYLCF